MDKEKRSPNDMLDGAHMSPVGPTSGSNKDRAKLAASSTTPSHVLAILSEDTSETVKLAVARNAKTPHHIVARLAKYGPLSVRAGLANDTNTPLELLNELAEDSDPAVRELAKQSRRALASRYSHLGEPPQRTKSLRPIGYLAPRLAQ